MGAVLILIVVEPQNSGNETRSSATRTRPVRVAKTERHRAFQKNGHKVGKDGAQKAHGGMICLRGTCQQRYAFRVPLDL